MNGAASGTSRRAFLGRAAGAAVTVAGAGVGAGAFASSAAAAAPKRSYTAGRFALDIDGVSCGRVAGVDGGYLEGDVALDPVGSDGIQRKHLAGVKYEDITVQAGAAMTTSFYTWIKDAFDGKIERRSASIRSGDSSWNEKSNHRGSQAYVSSVTVPALDRRSKDPAFLAVSLSCAKVTPVPPSGQPIQTTKQKAWIPSNFVFEIDGVDTSRVASIDSFTWKCSVAADGSLVMDVSDIGVTFPHADLSSWQQWYDNMISGANDERDGALTLIGAQGGAVVTFQLSRGGMYKLYSVTGQPTPVGRLMKAEMYVESVSWDLAKGKGG